ncbi:MAG: hypothetical protein NTY47_05380 [Candidatus Omnitrophica bacterium]|nr:hypothetical protein [Candidatus Omnitrophota bacterium]
MRKRLGKIAQTTAEYAVLIAVVVGAVVAMQIYVRRGLQGRVKDVVDRTAAANDVEATEIFTGNQYEPYYSVSASGSTRNAQESSTLQAGGVAARTSNEQTTQNRQTVTGWEQGDTATVPK